MANKIRLDVVTPDKIAYSDDANMVIVRSIDGDLGILPGHAPLIAALDVWPLRIQTDEGEKRFAVCGGFIEVQPEKITILSPCAELPEEIDVKRAESARERAEQRLKSRPEGLDVLRAEAALKRAIMRLRAAGNLK